MGNGTSVYSIESGRLGGSCQSSGGSSPARWAETDYRGDIDRPCCRCYEISSPRRALHRPAGLKVLTHAILAATLRGVSVEVFEPQGSEPGKAAMSTLAEFVKASGDPRRFRLVRSALDAPFAHLKVLVADGALAYIGSANITAAGLAGRNLELGVLVHGPQVAVIDRVLDIYRVVPSARGSDSR